MSGDEKAQWMVVRTAFGATHWSDPPATFGPMTKAEADKMASHPKYGGTVLSWEQFRKAGYH